MNELKIFQNPEFGAVRTIIIDEEIWFVGNDVARALEYKDLYSSMRHNVDERDRRVCPVSSTSGTQQTTVINESGLYSLIMGSKLPKAKEFRRWVTSDILPSIARTGSYSVEKKTDSYMINDPVERAKKWIEEQEAHKKEIEEKDKRIAEMLPGDTYFKAVCDSKLLTNFRDAGKELGMSQSQFIGWLKREKYVYSTNSGELRPMEKYRDSGLFQMKSYVNPYNGFSGVQTYLTPKGVQYFKLLIDAKNIIPDALSKHGGRKRK